MIVPVVTGDIDAGAVEELIALCVRYHGIRSTWAAAAGQDGVGAAATPGRAHIQDGTDTQDRTDPPDGAAASGDAAVVPAGLTGAAARQAAQAAAVAEILAGLEQQILATVFQVVSGPGGVASFLMGIWQVTAGRSQGS